MKKSHLCSLLLLTPFLLGATTDETVHEKSDMKYSLITESNAEEITNNYGYFEEMEFPTLTKGEESSWRLKTKFIRNTNRKLQIRLYYVYGTTAKWKTGYVGSTYYEVYRSGYLSGNVGTYTTFDISLKTALDDHGISTDSRYKIFNSTFAIGFYVDDHEGTSKGVFNYIYFASTFNTGKKYHLKLGSSLHTSYKLNNTDYNQEEYHKRVFFGGKDWHANTYCVAGGTFVDWRDFLHEDRGEIKTNIMSIPLKLQLSQFGKSAKINLPIEKADLSLFIYEGYELFDLGETQIGYDGEVGYKIPLRTYFDGTYVTFDTKGTYYTSLDCRRVYSMDSVPNGGRGNYLKVIKGLPLPSFEGKLPKTFKFQMELLNVGALGLVDITAKFSYTVSNNYFGSHKNSTYYVEEVIDG